MKKFASILDFKSKSILFSKQITGGYGEDCVVGDCTNYRTKTYTTMTVQVGFETTHIDVWTDNDTEQKPD